MLDAILNTFKYYLIKFSKSPMRWSGGDYCYIHFMNEETRAQCLSMFFLAFVSPYGDNFNNK